MLLLVPFQVALLLKTWCHFAETLITKKKLIIEFTMVILTYVIISKNFYKKYISVNFLYAKVRLGANTFLRIVNKSFS